MTSGAWMHPTCLSVVCTQLVSELLVYPIEGGAGRTNALHYHEATGLACVGADCILGSSYIGQLVFNLLAGGLEEIADVDPNV